MSEETKVSTIKKEKPQKQKTNKEKKSNNNWAMILICGFVAIILSVAAFFVLLSQEKKALDEGEKVQVYVAKNDIASGTAITKSMLEQKYIITDLVPSTAKNITEKDLEGSLFVLTNLNKNGILTKDMLSPVAEDGTQEIGIATESLASVINGILRDSDYIDIYVVPENWDPTNPVYASASYNVTNVDSETGEVTTSTEETSVPTGEVTYNYNIEPTFQHVYVSKVFDADGNRIANSDLESKVNNFNIMLNKEDANFLVGALQTGRVYITKYRISEPGDYISNVEKQFPSEVITYIEETTPVIEETVEVSDEEEISDEEEVSDEIVEETITNDTETTENNETPVETE